MKAAEIREQLYEILEFVCSETDTEKSEWNVLFNDKEIIVYHSIYGYYIFPIE